MLKYFFIVFSFLILLSSFGCTAGSRVEVFGGSVTNQEVTQLKSNTGTSAQALALEINHSLVSLDQGLLKMGEILSKSKDLDPLENSFLGLDAERIEEGSVAAVAHGLYPVRRARDRWYPKRRLRISRRNRRRTT